MPPFLLSPQTVGAANDSFICWFALALLTGATGSAASSSSDELFGNTSSGSGGSTSSATNVTSTNANSSTSTSAAGGTGGQINNGGAGGAQPCGNGTCDPDETDVNCPQDCPNTCAHSVCEVGSDLAAGCSACVELVCAQDDNCCDGSWDQQCIAVADQLCGSGCCGNGVCEGQTCDVCPTDCGACVCGDGMCEGENCSDCAADCGNCPDCDHGVCQSGTALTASSCKDPCVTQVCMQDPSCCPTVPGAETARPWAMAYAPPATPA